MFFGVLSCVCLFLSPWIQGYSIMYIDICDYMDHIVNSNVKFHVSIAQSTYGFQDVILPCLENEFTPFYQSLPISETLTSIKTY